jgi:hypothetical protein
MYIAKLFLKMPSTATLALLALGTLGFETQKGLLLFMSRWPIKVIYEVIMDSFNGGFMSNFKGS